MDGNNIYKKTIFFGTISLCLLIIVLIHGFYKNSVSQEERSQKYLEKLSSFSCLKSLEIRGVIVGKDVVMQGIKEGFYNINIELADPSFVMKDCPPFLVVESDSMIRLRIERTGSKAWDLGKMVFKSSEADYFMIYEAGSDSIRRDLDYTFGVF